MNIYEIVLSTKDRIAIDQTDLDKVKANAKTGNFIVLKQGVVNPSFIVAIIPKTPEKSKDVIEDGYVDEERGVFVPTKVAADQPPLADEFSAQTKTLAAKMKA